MINTNALENDIIAETFPLDNAVNSPEANILIPTNRNENANILSPTSAKVYTTDDGLTKILIIVGANIKDKINIIIEEDTINFFE